MVKQEGETPELPEALSGSQAQLWATLLMQGLHNPEFAVNLLLEPRETIKRIAFDDSDTDAITKFQLAISNHVPAVESEPEAHEGDPPKLLPNELHVLQLIFTRFAHKFEYGIHFIMNQETTLKEFNLTDEEVQRIMHYFDYIHWRANVEELCAY